jgi:hypothetical protein
MPDAEIALTGFELIERLGLGGMGVVWKARQLSLDRLVAIKLVRPESSRSADDVKQMLQEARTAAKLKHPGIVQVYDACEQNGTFFLVMEHVDGYTIGQWLRRRKQLPVKEVLLIAESVAVALQYAWQAAELIHCDIKPENVMVDQDGTIKVADLGLSLTKDSGDYTLANEITGTPGYMSPEQVRGDVKLDCRTDIYALGSMMYELLTGVRPFANRSDTETMECQLNDKIGDPRDVVPGIPLCVCMLLERMLVKDRENRSGDWTQVLADLRRVSRGMFPDSPAPVPGASTLSLRRAPVSAASGDGVPVTVPSGSGGKMMGPLFLLFLMLAGFAGYMIWSDSKAPVIEPVVQPVAVLPMKGLVVKDKEPEAKQWFDVANQWGKEHSGAYEESVNRFRSVVDSYPGTEASRRAVEEIEQIYLRRELDQKKAWSSITQKTAELVKAGDIKGALVFVEQYSGAFVLETESNRLVLARGLRQQLADGEVGRVEEDAWHGFVDRTAGVLMDGKMLAVREEVAAVVKSGRFPRHGEALAALEELLQEARVASGRILESYRGEIGKEQTIRVGRGEMRIQVTGINDRKVVAMMADDRSQISFNPEDLPLDERLRRMGDPDSAGAALAKGLVALAGRDFQEAEALFSKTGPILSGPLLERLNEVKTARTEEELIAMLGRILRAGGMVVGAYDETEWVKAVQQARMTREQVTSVNLQREKFLMENGMSEFAVKAAPVLLALEQRCAVVLQSEPVVVKAGEPVVPTNGVRTRVDIETVLRRFRGQNPGVQEAAVSSYTVPSGGKGVKVVSDSVVDLNALAENGGFRGIWLETVQAQNVGLDFQPLAKAGLKEIRLAGYTPLDLNAFRGMALEHLVLHGANATNYSALEGLPLEELDLTDSNIRDLSWMRGMKVETLNLKGTKVVSLMALSGLPLTTLNLRGVPVRDIGALRRLPLETLDLSETQVMDFSVLRVLNLKSLCMAKTPVKDIGFCSQMPLDTLDIGDTGVADISVLRGKNMRRLILARTGVKDISPLAGSRIETLDLSGTRIPCSMLSQVLVKVQFQEIALDGVELTRLDFLHGKNLRRVSIAGTKVTDVSALANMTNLQMLTVKGLRIDDASPLGTLTSLQDIWCDLDPMQVRVLLSDLPSLRRVNGISRDEMRN